MQFALGAGPCRDAYLRDEPVYEPDLERPSVGHWHEFVGSALENGFRGVFAFPLRVGVAKIGVMTLYQDDAGRLSDAQTADSLVLADVLAQTMVSMHARTGGDVLAEDLMDPGGHLAEVQQASGMVAVQLGIEVDEALARIRAHAFATDRPVAAVAADVVARRLTMHHDEPRAER